MNANLSTACVGGAALTLYCRSRSSRRNHRKIVSLTECVAEHFIQRSKATYPLKNARRDARTSTH
eukprot:1675663-Rhodomonas_salina.1